MLDVFAQHLLPEIGTGIDHQRNPFGFDQGGSAQPFVAAVGRGADPAPARDNRNALRGTGAQKRKFGHEALI